MDTTIKTQEQQASVRQFNCTGCGNALTVQHPRAQNIACPYCGSVLDLNTEAHGILSKMGNPERHAPMSFIRLGMTAEFDGRTYQVIARTRYLQKYQEYWREEGESGYSSEVWRFDEWLLIDSRRTYFYLIEDQEGYWISEEIIPDNPMMPPKSLRMSFFNGQRDQIVKEYGKANVIYFEGESNYQVKEKDEVQFGMYDHQGINYSVEWRMKGPSDIAEIEFFKETPISRRKVLEAFRNNEELDALRQQEARWRFVNKVSKVAAFILGILSLFSCNYTGKQVFNQAISMQDIIQANGLTTDPITIDKDDVYRFKLDAQGLAENSEVYLFAYILDAEKQVVNKIEQEMFFYAGYDSDGRWTETQLDHSERYKLKKGDTYYLQFFADTDNPTMVTGQLILTVGQGVMMTRYFFLAMIISLVVMFIARTRYGG